MDIYKPMWWFVDFINQYSGYYTVVVTLALVVVTSLYVVLTRKQVSQMLLFNKVRQHRELSEKVYLPIIEWLSPLKDIHLLCGSTYDVNRIIQEGWLSYKKSLPYVVYLMDSAFELRIKRICGLFSEYKRVHEQFIQRLNGVIAKVMYPFNNSMKIIRVSGEGTLRPFIGYFCSEEEMKYLLNFMNGHQVRWGYDTNSRGFVDESSDNNIQPLNYDNFVSKIDEVNKIINADNELKSYRERVRKIIIQANDLIKQLEKQISLDDMAIAKVYGIRY